jgi:virulence-associated protein VagC
MTRQNINIGSNANAGDGDTLRVAMDKINQNFIELYNETAVDSGITISGNNISANRTNDDIVFVPAGTGAVSFPAIRIDDNEITGTRTNEDIIITPSGTGRVLVAAFRFNGNNIEGTRSNEDIIIAPSGTGTVNITDLTIDNNINFTDNIIRTTASNSDLILSAAGTGEIIIDSISIKDNTISTNASNANLELSANGTGTVVLNGLHFPTADGNSGDVLTTNGLGVLSFSAPAASFTYSILDDGAELVASSAQTPMDTFSATTYRSAKYFVQVKDTENTRYELVELNITHDGSTAYISVSGSVSTYTSSLVTFDADVNSGNVRVLVVPVGGGSYTYKFQRILIKS